MHAVARRRRRQTSARESGSRRATPGTHSAVAIPRFTKVCVGIADRSGRVPKRSVTLARFHRPVRDSTLRVSRSTVRWASMALGVGSREFAEIIERIGCMHMPAIRIAEERDERERGPENGRGILASRSAPSSFRALEEGREDHGAVLDRLRSRCTSRQIEPCEISTPPPVPARGSLKTRSPAMRTNLKQELMRQQAVELEKKERESRSRGFREQEASQPSLLHIPSSLPRRVLQVRTRLENPTKYHVLESQKRQVLEYLQHDSGIGTSKTTTTATRGNVSPGTGKFRVRSRMIMARSHCLHDDGSEISDPPSSPPLSLFLLFVFVDIGSDSEAGLVLPRISSE
ncbi:unnamed protein product [Darwinula stevensoni]|uniref:MiT/TFE transcription factors N-terminal domain-containing protein n=1 Tax=Darwinula stevensoni TaxID=69355 RepID=A0A7R8X423_9CRUS|nr:unnamed protein product [Darwinula stevensoni]CAG0883179.1 unnamed protein product [Darwinula stevensoni]